jgi:hypothetical protein
MLATLVGLSMLLALIGGTATLAGCCLAGGYGLVWPGGIPSRPPLVSGPVRRGGWPPSGPCWPRPWAWATGIGGPASTGSPPQSSSPTTRA